MKLISLLNMNFALLHLLPRWLFWPRRERLVRINILSVPKKSDKDHKRRVYPAKPTYENW